MTRPSDHPSAGSAWLVAGLLVATATVLAGLTMFGGARMPSEVPTATRVLDRLDPAVEVGDLEIPLERESALSSAAANRGTSDSRQLDVYIEGYQRAEGLPLRVELLFGERQGIKTVTLFTDREGRASWPSGSEAPWPRFAGFAFPTVNAAGQALSAGDTDVRLTMPEVCVLEVEVVEVGGRVTDEKVSLQVRSPSAAWPHNRWHPVRLEGGRQRLLAEAAGELIEVSVQTALGRSASATFFAATAAGQRVACSVQLAPGNGVDIDLQGLPVEPVDASWVVDVHDLVGAKMAAHQWPGGQGRYVVFAHRDPGHASQPWLVMAQSSSGGRQLYWGRAEGAEGARRAPMQPCQVVAAGRVIDQNGAPVPRYHVDLVTRGSRIVVSGVISSRDGSFELVGPDPSQVAMDVVLREGRDNQPPAVPLPADGKMSLLVNR